MNPNFTEYSASDYRAIARRALTGFWGVALGVTLLAALLGGVTTGTFSFEFNFDEQTISELYHYAPSLSRFLHVLWQLTPLMAFFSMLSLVQVIIGGSVQIGLCRFYLHRLDGRPAEVGDLFSAFDIFGRALWLRILMGLKIFAWTLLFIIPGIVAALRYAMAPYILAENPQLTASQAIELSKQMMDGKKGDLFVLNLSFIGWALLAGLTFGIGLLWLNPYMGMAETAFYRSVAPSVYFRQQPGSGDYQPPNNGYQPPNNDYQQPNSNYQRPTNDWYHSDTNHRGPEL